MQKINLWEICDRISIKVNERFLHIVKKKLFELYKTKRYVYSLIKDKAGISYTTFSSVLKESHQRKYFVQLNIWICLCQLLDINPNELQSNIISYKTSNGPNYISKPILPVEINPIFDMILAHNIADGTVINPGNNRLPYFGYRQFDPLFRELYIRKLEEVFGIINFPEKYYEKTTRPYCPPVLASLFFKIYKLNIKSFLSTTARIPVQILHKNNDYLLGVLIAFIIDEGNIDSTTIVISLKNIDLTDDIFNICKKLKYETTLTTSGEYGHVFILRKGMIKFFNDYKNFINKYPVATLGKWETKIAKGFEIYERSIYKTKGNQDIILGLLKKRDLTVNQIAGIINMTRQGVRFHVHRLENSSFILRVGFMGKKNIVYGYRRR